MNYIQSLSMEPSDNFIFRSGQYEGKTYGLVKKINPGYIEWVKLNQPKMLQEKKEKQKPVEFKPAPIRKDVSELPDSIPNSMQPNLDFLSQKGDYQFYKKDEDGNKS